MHFNPEREIKNKVFVILLKHLIINQQQNGLSSIGIAYIIIVLYTVSYHKFKAVN